MAKIYETLTKFNLYFIISVLNILNETNIKNVSAITNHIEPTGLYTFHACFRIYSTFDLASKHNYACAQEAIQALNVLNKQNILNKNMNTQEICEFNKQQTIRIIKNLMVTNMQNTATLISTINENQEFKSYLPCLEFNEYKVPKLQLIYLLPDFEMLPTEIPLEPNTCYHPSMKINFRQITMQECALFYLKVKEPWYI